MKEKTHASHSPRRDPVFDSVRKAVSKEGVLFNFKALTLSSMTPYSTLVFFISKSKGKPWYMEILPNQEKPLRTLKGRVLPTHPQAVPDE